MATEKLFCSQQFFFKSIVFRELFYRCVSFFNLKPSSLVAFIYMNIFVAIGIKRNKYNLFNICFILNLS